VLSQPSYCTPVFSTVRDWLLKLGLFHLQQTHEAGEWGWIVDCSIQMGAMKCLLILGVRLEVLKKRGNFTLSHNDVKPIILRTVESCPGEFVKEALNEAKKKTQGAVVIVSDEGSELKRGVRLFQEEQMEGQRPIHLHDITHKVDLVLKRELEKDDKWKEFTRQMTNTTQQLKLSASSHLIPPKQRQKKRMRSEIDIIEWGMKILNYLESGKANEFEKNKLSWIFNYRVQLNIYREMAILFDMATKEVREQGYRRGTVKILRERGASIACSERSRSFFSKILKTIEGEENKVPQGICLPGCSEVIESVFGKYKQLEKNHASGGLTSLVLSLPALVGDMTIEIVKNAMERISIKQVKEWVKENLGCTFWSERRNDLHFDIGIGGERYLDQDENRKLAAG
jgi:hypothetical protein